MVQGEVEGVPAASPVPREARAYQGQRAGLVTRGLAATVDGLVVVAVVASGYVALNVAVFVVNPRGFRVVSVSAAVLLAAWLAMAFIYLAVAWWAVGRSYGCHVLGLRVVDHRGLKPHLLVAVARALACVVFPLGLGWCAVGPSRRSVQDLVLGTHVFYDWLPGPAHGVDGGVQAA